MENAEENPDVPVKPRFFMRRVIAYVVDLLTVAIIFTIIAVALNSVFGTKFMAPSFVRSTFCNQTDFLSKERFNNVFPDEPGVERGQFVCTYTTMGITSIKLGLVVRATKKDGINYRQNVSLPLADIDGEIAAAEYLLLDQLMYILAPLFFAYLLSRSGKTFGKQLVGLKVSNENGDTPGISSALKREYIKGFPFVVLGIYGLYEMGVSSGLSYEKSVELLGPLTEMLAFDGFGVVFAAGIGFSIALFWFMFGSFIRWRGQAYWDRWIGLFVNGNVKLRPPATSAGSQAN